VSVSETDPRDVPGSSQLRESDSERIFKKLKKIGKKIIKKVVKKQGFSSAEQAAMDVAADPTNAKLAFSALAETRSAASYEESTLRTRMATSSALKAAHTALAAITGGSGNADQKSRLAPVRAAQIDAGEAVRNAAMGVAEANKFGIAAMNSWGGPTNAAGQPAAGASTPGILGGSVVGNLFGDQPQALLPPPRKSKGYRCLRTVTKSRFGSTVMTEICSKKALVAFRLAPGVGIRSGVGLDVLQAAMGTKKKGNPVELASALPAPFPDDSEDDDAPATPAPPPPQDGKGKGKGKGQPQVKDSPYPYEPIMEWAIPPSDGLHTGDATENGKGGAATPTEDAEYGKGDPTPTEDAEYGTVPTPTDDAGAYGKGAPTPTEDAEYGKGDPTGNTGDADYGKGGAQPDTPNTTEDADFGKGDPEAAAYARKKSARLLRPSSYNTRPQKSRH